ncbi:MAG: hypothetical protein QHH06_06270 [Clostridiales bacterium]|jgi:hypothetical protein|nr:hypothetical protein [Eubacteriales bacterium]MDH7566069.1 hypothetical protein [Clostridiales bacterium]
MEKKIDITKYPEGFDEVVKTLDFLPDDYNTRANYIVGVILFLMWA